MFTMHGHKNLNRQITGIILKLLIKFCPVEGRLLHADGQTDMTKLVIALRSFAKAPKNMDSDNFAPKTVQN